MFWTWLTFSRKIIFCFSKRCSEGREQYFLRLLGSHREKKNKSVKEFICFSTTDVFVPVSQLSTRDLFYFLENLKIKQDIFVLDFSSISIIRTTSVMIPLFQIIFRNSFQESVDSWVFGVFTKSIVVSILDFFWHISVQKDVLFIDL